MFFLRLLCRFVFFFIIRVKIIDIEKFPEEGAVLVAGNHESMIDMFMIGVKLKRYVKWMAKEELFRNKLMAKFVTACGAYPVRRHSKDGTAVQKTLELLAQGEAVGLFPQGTRSHGRGRENKARSGIARIAIESGALIQPVAIWGKIRPFGKVYVKFGDPYHLEKPEGVVYTKEDYLVIAQKVLDDVYDMIDKAKEGAGGNGNN